MDLPQNLLFTAAFCQKQKFADSAIAYKKPNRLVTKGEA
jgi:hypothetical protein